MSDKPTLEELRENARTNYGITNADDLSAEVLQSEIDAIDKQAEDARKESEDAGEATVDAVSNSGDDQSDDDEDDDEDEDEEDTVDLGSLNRVDLEAAATEAGVEDPSNKELYPTKAALQAAVEAKQAEQV